MCVLAAGLQFCFVSLSFGDKDLAAAANLVDSGDYTMAITRLAALIEKRPNTDAAHEALYHLGRAYEGIGSPAEALERYAEYLVRVPGGTYESEAILAFRRVYAAQAERFPSQEALEDLRSAFNADPEDIDTGLDLAATLWRAGRYDEAADVYAKLLAIDPALAEDPVFSSRIHIAPDGELIPLSPEEQARRDAEVRPVTVFNTASYLGGRERFTQKPRWYIVTGEVMNRSERTVNHVEVQTTIYAFGNTIYDTVVQRLGRLSPGQTRAFTARFTRFEDINNVSRYECTVTHD